ncbi:hypothetical protein K525DRAFT_275745 [Schizophyllum commune Loenen D]|nr:hypothetical protein K525DRAFT_275745 [Schizophyllum commune Loenen D]
MPVGLQLPLLDERRERMDSGKGAFFTRIVNRDQASHRLTRDQSEIALSISEAG